MIEIIDNYLTEVEFNMVEKIINSEELSKDRSIQKKTNIDELILNKKSNEPIVTEVRENDNFFIKTLDGLIIDGKILGYIMCPEQNKCRY